MLDIGWQELFLIAIFAILVVGPKDLPRMMKTVMQWVRKARGLAREFQNGVDEMVREADLDDIKKDIGSISKPGDLTKTITDAVDPTGELGDIQKDMDKTAKDAIKEKPAEKSTPEDLSKKAEQESPFKNKSGDELRTLMAQDAVAKEAAATKERTATEEGPAQETAATEETDSDDTSGKTASETAEIEKKPEQTGKAL